MKSDDKVASSNEPTEIDPRIRDLRREVIAAENQISELQDQITRRETERADAIALLGQLELQLERKIGYIVSLDQSLNLRIRELEDECERKSTEIENRGTALKNAEQLDEKNRSERDTIIADLSARLDAANQETSKAHEIARGLDQQRAEVANEKEQTEAKLSETAETLRKTHELLTAETTRAQQISQQRDSVQQELESTRASLAEAQAKQEATNASLDQAADRLTEIKSSALWRLSRPWRALFGPKS